MRINGKFGDSNCSFEGEEQFKSPKCTFESTLEGLFDTNPFYQTVRLNAIYCIFKLDFLFDLLSMNGNFSFYQFIMIKFLKKP